MCFRNNEGNDQYNDDKAFILNEFFIPPSIFNTSQKPIRNFNFVSGFNTSISPILITPKNTANHKKRLNKLNGGTFKFKHFREQTMYHFYNEQN